MWMTVIWITVGAAIVPPTDVQSRACILNERASSVTALADQAIAAAWACYYQGELTEGVRIVDVALRQLGPEGDVRRRTSLWTRRGQLLATRAFVTNRGVDDAVETLEGAVSLASGLGPGPELADALTQLGFALYTKSFLTRDPDLSSARRLFEQAYEIRAELREPRGLAEALFYRGIMREREGDADGAMGLYREALTTAESCDCALEASYAHRHIAFLLQAQGDLPAALRHFQRSLDLREGIGFTVYLPLSFLALADVRRELGDSDAARSLTRRAEELSVTLGETRVTVLCHLTLGETALTAGDVEGARTAFSKALRLAEEIGYGTGMEAARDGLERASGHRGARP